MRPVVDAAHTCWSYDDFRPFDRFARHYLRAGIDAGERVLFVGGPRSGPTAEWLRGVGETIGRPDPVQVVACTDAYPGEAVIDPAGQVEAYAMATAAAVADGFTGLRVVADVTELVRADHQLEAFARYEYVIGRHIRTAPMRAVCAYDRRELGDRVVAQLACLHETSHTASHAPGVTFHLHAGPTPDTAVLDGDLDLVGEELFAAALDLAALEPVDGRVTVDAHGLHFIDHRSMLILERYAESREVTVTLRTRLGTAARVAELLDLPRVRVERAG